MAAPPPSQWQRWQNGIRVGVGVIAIALGLWGWYRQLTPHDLYGRVEILFRTLQMLTFQFPRDTGSALPWQLNLARFLLPAVALFETYRLVLGSLRSPMRLALLGLRHGHVIALGIGTPATSLLRSLRVLRRAPVAVLEDPATEQVQLLESEGIAVLSGDPRNSETWRRAAASTAGAIFLLNGDDLENLNVAVTVAQSLRPAKSDHPPLLVVRVERTELAGEVDAALDQAQRGGWLRYRRLSIAEEAARALFLDPPLAARKPDRGVRSHVLILGFGPGGLAVLRQALMLAQDSPDAGPCITILAEATDLAGEALLAPGAIPPFIAELRVFESDWQDGLPVRLAEALAGTPPVSLACVCRGDATAVVTAIALARRAGLGCPVRAHQSREDRFLAALAASGAAGGALADVAAFGGVLSQRAVERILDERDDGLARQIHASYLASLPAGSTGTDAAWDALPENLRHSNRAAADHVAVKLAVLGAPAGSPPPPLDPSQIEALARIEHRRWCAERFLRGWRPGPRGLATRLTADLLDYTSLDETSRQKNREAVAALPDLLRAAGR